MSFVLVLYLKASMHGQTGNLVQPCSKLGKFAEDCAEDDRGGVRVRHAMPGELPRQHETDLVYTNLWELNFPSQIVVSLRVAWVRSGCGSGSTHCRKASVVGRWACFWCCASILCRCQFDQGIYQHFLRAKSPSMCAPAPAVGTDWPWSVWECSCVCATSFTSPYSHASSL